MSTISSIKTQIQDLIGVDSSDTTVAARLLRWINNARRVLYQERDWEALRGKYQLKRIPVYSTGTVSITQDARVVTGVGTTFTDAMVGRYINFGNTNQSQWYYIVKVNSTTELVIEADYIGSTLSGKAYKIQKIFYRIPAAAKKLDNVSQFVSPRLIDEIGDQTFLGPYGSYHTSGGTSSKYQLMGTYDKKNTYTTGTLSGSQYGTVLTGAGTAWMDEALPGDLITIDGQEYAIKSIDSDTQITLYAGLTTAAGALTTYSLATNPDSWMIRFDSQASVREIIIIEYYGHSFDLLNDTDSDFFIRRHPDVVVEGAAIWEKRAQEDASWAVDYQKWVASIRGSFGETANDGIWSPRLEEPQYE